MSLRVVCINKDGGNHQNPYESISRLGWKSDAGKVETCTLAAMVDFLEKGNKAYTQDSNGNMAFLGVNVSAAGHKYVQTHADGKWNNNLLSLNECPLVRS